MTRNIGPLYFKQLKYKFYIFKPEEETRTEETRTEETRPEETKPEVIFLISFVY